MIHFAYPLVLFIGLPLFLVILFVKNRYFKSVIYTYPLTHMLKQNTKSLWINPLKFFSYLKALVIVLLIIALARPQMPDTRTEVSVQGIDIMLALDVSGSMMLFDDMKDQRTRIDVAREEAIKFINRRINDPIGIVIFGREILTRAPLTLDKKMLTTLLDDTKIGTLQSNGTMLSWGLTTAINRLKNSKAESKIIILLTDGSPTEGDVDPKSVVELARKLGIKIYTVGIGADEGGMYDHPFYGVVREQYSALNKQLLSYIAQETGGQFFESRKPKDMEKIYNQIDMLEKTEHKAPLFQHYFELFRYILILVLILLAIEALLSLYKWVIL